MTATSTDRTISSVGDFLRRRREALIGQWSVAAFFQPPDPGRDHGDQVTRDCAEILDGLTEAVVAGEAENPSAQAFTGLRPLLSALVSPYDQVDTGAATAAGMSALKEPLLRLWEEDTPPEEATAGALLLAAAVDTLRLVVLDTTLSAVKETLDTQRDQLTELSTPVIKLWDGVLAIPLIGTLDSMRSQVATESLLQAILNHQARVAILDITGVETVDTMVAQHLLKTAQAARLMGAECVISGIRPQIATTMVQLGIDLDEVVTKARLSDAFEYALGRLGLSVAPNGLR